MIRVVLPSPLRALANADAEITLAIEAPVTQRAVVDAIERAFPMLRGTIREHGADTRRAMVRFFAEERDLSFEPMDTPLPDSVAAGREPLLIVGAVAGG
jgi:sulfur-carrier protein